MNLFELRKLCASHTMEWTQHSAKRLLQRGISADEIDEIIMNGEIIEDYPDAYPFPACLILGKTEKGKQLHIVCAIGEGKLWIITAYEPSLFEWTPDFRTRKENI